MAILSGCGQAKLDETKEALKQILTEAESVLEEAENQGIGEKTEAAEAEDGLEKITTEIEDFSEKLEEEQEEIETEEETRKSETEEKAEDIVVVKEEVFEKTGEKNINSIEKEEIAEVIEENTDQMEEVVPQTEKVEIPKEYYYYESLLTDILENPSLHEDVFFYYANYQPGPAEFMLIDIDGDSEQELLIKSTVYGYISDYGWDGISVYKFSENCGSKPNYQYVGDTVFYNDGSVIVANEKLITKVDGVPVETDHVSIEFYELGKLVEQFTTGTGAVSKEEYEVRVAQFIGGKQEVALSWIPLSKENILEAVNSGFH